MEWYHVWRPWLTSKHVARFVSDIWVSCSFYHCCHMLSVVHSDTADYELQTVDCQIVILFSGVWAPPQKKKLENLLLKLHVLLYLSNTPTLMQISCFITACNECGNSPPNSHYTTYIYTQKSPATKNYHGAIGGRPPPPPWIRHLLAVVGWCSTAVSAPVGYIMPWSVKLLGLYVI